MICNRPKEIQLLIILSLGSSDLREHKFKHNFHDALGPICTICNCGKDFKSSCYYPVHCSVFINWRLAFLNDIQAIDNSISELSNSHKSEVLFDGRKFSDISSNTIVMNDIIDFLLKAKRFDE